MIRGKKAAAAAAIAITAALALTSCAGGRRHRRRRRPDGPTGYTHLGAITRADDLRPVRARSRATAAPSSRPCSTPSCRRTPRATSSPGSPPRGRTTTTTRSSPSPSATTSRSPMASAGGGVVVATSSASATAPRPRRLLRRHGLRRARRHDRHITLDAPDPSHAQLPRSHPGLSSAESFDDPDSPRTRSARDRTSSTPPPRSPGPATSTRPTRTTGTPTSQHYDNLTINVIEDPDRRAERYQGRRGERREDRDQRQRSPRSRLRAGRSTPTSSTSRACCCSTAPAPWRPSSPT